MTEDQLLYFTSIVECGSYSEAALDLNISQSTISKQVAQLESELNVKLFDRSTRKASLTQPWRQKKDRYHRTAVCRQPQLLCSDLHI